MSGLAWPTNGITASRARRRDVSAIFWRLGRRRARAIIGMPPAGASVTVRRCVLAGRSCTRPSSVVSTKVATTILISHRFSTVRHADRICVLEHGRVVELGSHDELIALGGRYKTMFELQAKRFEATMDEEGVVFDVL